MEKKLIQFDELSYNRDINTINRIADKVNENLNLLVEENEITIDFIKNLLCNPDFIKTVKFSEQIEKFRKNFNLQNVPLDYSKHEFIFTMANSSIQYLFAFRNKVGAVSCENEYFFNEGLLYLDNGKLCISSNYKEIIKEKHSYYTKTEKQNKVLEKVKIIESALNEIKDLTGGRIFSINKLIYPFYGRNEFIFNKQTFNYLTKEK
ncbi:MAG: hypothetical protein PHO63_05560 [Bacilli bacterium]|nr:hypothetical protein [Bacilli bacterium]